MSRLTLILGGIFIAGVVIAIAISIPLIIRHTSKETEQKAVIVKPMDTFIQLLRSPDEQIGFPKGVSPRVLSFPKDHGPHLENRLEWWYYTGNLETESGRHFGYQLTFFRMALTPNPVQRESKWATNQMYMAHFALTDVKNKRFYASERKSRGAVGLAGAVAQPFEVWVENWSAIDGSQLPQIRPGIARAAGSSMHLSATEDGTAINLLLKEGKPVVLGGDNGRVIKSAEASMTSYYYSLSRMPTNGTIRVAGVTFQVKGLSWLDREWGNGLLGKDQVGWSWFALQLSDEREMMFYLLRGRGGRTDPFSRGVFVRIDGSIRLLTLDDVQIEVLDYWESPFGSRYPSGWQIYIPSEKLTLGIEPYLANQELDLSMGRYWEGAVKVEGTSHGQPISGNGYVELTGFSRE
ncbi:carotenoid 1,2-hydratase [Candidatus Poribacteria bacterium]|nr:carotenoid 1,2-hydratase [Candidatus Poribacteria bacterium]